MPVKLLLLVCLMFQFSFAVENSPGPTSGTHLVKPFYLGGISIDEPDEAQFTQLVKNIGMNTIEVTHYAMQGEWDSDELYTDQSKQKTINKVRLAKENGMKVVLVLRVHLIENFDRNKFLWHGMIMPRGENNLNNWFDRYKNFVRSWAIVCAEEGIDVLVIGSELNALSATVPIKRMPSLYTYFNDRLAQRSYEGKLLKFEEELANTRIWREAKTEYQSLENFVKQKIQAQHNWARQVCFIENRDHLDLMNARRHFIDQRWRAIISECRSIFSGQIGYAANFDNYQEVGFWDALDFIGINAYFPLTGSSTNCETLKCYEKKCYKSWRNILKEIKGFQGKSKLKDKPVIFTELGYINRKYATLEPWKGFGYSIIDGLFQDKLLIWEEQSLNNQERVGAVKALHRAVKKEKFPLQGLLYWRLTSDTSNLEKEPFGLFISDPAIDPLQEALLEFNRK